MQKAASNKTDVDLKRLNNSQEGVSVSGSTSGPSMSPRTVIKSEFDHSIESSVHAPQGSTASTAGNTQPIYRSDTLEDKVSSKEPLEALVLNKLPIGSQADCLAQLKTAIQNGTHNTEINKVATRLLEHYVSNYDSINTELFQRAIMCDNYAILNELITHYQDKKDDLHSSLLLDLIKSSIWNSKLCLIGLLKKHLTQDIIRGIARFSDKDKSAILLFSVKNNLLDIFKLLMQNPEFVPITSEMIEKLLKTMVKLSEGFNPDDSLAFIDYIEKNHSEIIKKAQMNRNQILHYFIKSQHEYLNRMGLSEAVIKRSDNTPTWVLRKLLSLGFNPNDQANSLRDTPLHIALMLNEQMCARMLLVSSNINLTLRNFNDESPLSIIEKDDRFVELRAVIERSQQPSKKPSKNPSKNPSKQKVSTNLSKKLDQRLDPKASFSDRWV